MHANLPALEATLAEIERLAVDAVYCGGYLVGYGPQPNEVYDLIEERAIPTIYGNYDYAIGRDLEDCGCASIDQTTARSASSLRVVASIRRVAYDAVMVAREMQSVVLPEELADRLVAAA